LFVLLAFVLMSSSMIAALFGIQDLPNAENRTLAQEPSFDLMALSKFPAAYENYFNDHFGLRNWFIRVYYTVRLTLLRETVFKSIVIGKNNWLFYTDEHNIDYYQCSNPLSDKRLATIQQSLDTTKHLLNERGMTFLVVMVPNKEEIYPEFLPDYIQRIGDRCQLDQISDYMRLNGETSLIDLRQSLLNANEEHLIYHQMDTHWNDYGVYVAYREIMAQLAKEFPQLKAHPLSDFREVMLRAGGDLTRFSNHPEIFSEDRYELKPTFLPAARTNKVKDTWISENTNQALPRLVMFMDSFGDPLVPFLSEHFSYAEYYQLHYVNFSILNQAKPDVVILEVVERYAGDRLMISPDVNR
jgi:hypothetical protein